jgi:hypothetical protein
MSIYDGRAVSPFLRAAISGFILFGALSVKAHIGEQVPNDGRVQVAAYYFPNWHEEAHPAVSHGEWEALKNAKPRFAGHMQPVVPLWGYQDEADPAVMAQKIDAAADNGVGAFLFDWYWRNGVKGKGPMLERALDDGYLKAPNRGRVKFALMWANHDLGEDSPGAINRQVFDAITDHIVRDYFTKESYWMVDGRCYFSIYQLRTFIEGLGGLDQAKMALDSLRAKTIAAGRKGVYLNAMDWQLPNDARNAIKTLGIDSVTSYVWVHIIKLKDFPKTDYAWVAGQYFAQWDAQHETYGVPYFPNVTSGWDPSPRVPESVPYDGKKYPNTPILGDNSPERFKRALEQARLRAVRLPEGQRIVTIYAWNEWTEGGFLEPDTRNKLASLSAIKQVFGVSTH